MTDARKLLATRAIRGLADGVVGVALATYLTGLGFSPFEVGATITGTLLGLRPSGHSWSSRLPEP